jgi:nucleotide-binding universal stress UspA family protein
MNPIMLATDGSPTAEAATDQAIELAQALGAPLVVVCVRHDKTPAYGYYGYAEIVSDMREIEQERIDEVSQRVEDLAAEAGVSCRTMVLDGLPGEQICKAAEDREARLIVLGAHGWGRLGRLLHGSVSTYVLHHATTPVLVVQGEDALVPEPAGL